MLYTLFEVDQRISAAILAFQINSDVIKEKTIYPVTDFLTKRVGHRNVSLELHKNV